MTKEGGINKNKGKKCGYKENNSGSGFNKKLKLECWKCGKTCHFKKDCRSGNKKNNANDGGSGKGSKDQGQNLVHVWNRFIEYCVSLFSESFYMQVDTTTWWIDSGATTHVCKDHCWFKTYEPMEDRSVLYMGDDHFAPFHGKGSVVLEFSFGKSITLFNMLYAPELRKNLISGHVLNKCGYKQDCRSGNKKNNANDGGSGKGSKDQGQNLVDTTTWWIDSGATTHVCKDHCWFKTYEPMEDRSVLYMGDDHFAPFHGKGSVVLEFSFGKSITLFNMLYAPELRIIHETTTPYTPQQNGVAERKSRALKEMAIVRLSDPKRKTLGEKGIDCIFVGYVEHSKAYRIYNEAMQSRDATFWKEAIDEICSIMK
nr:zinc finger, CCHC-type [Tanacetum cinerariifolium]